MKSLRPSDAHIIDSDYGLSHGRYQAIIWANAGYLSLDPKEHNSASVKYHLKLKSFHKKMHFKSHL